MDEWHFAPAIGGIVHIVDGMRVNVKGLAGHQKLINHFQMLREDGLLTLLRSIDSGHELFHGHDGHVDVYVYRAPAVVPHE